MSTSTVWRIGNFLNAVQSSFVGLLRVWSIPLVLMLSLASGYTTYYGMSSFITGWIAAIITVAVQSVLVICTLELAGMHLRANPTRFMATLLSLLVALTVSISFSYFKFYEFSEHDQIKTRRITQLQAGLNDYLNQLGSTVGELAQQQKQRSEAAAQSADQAYIGSHPAMQAEFHNRVGKGPFWNHYHEIQLAEEQRLVELRRKLEPLNEQMLRLRKSLGEFSLHAQDRSAYEQLVMNYQTVQSLGESLFTEQGAVPLIARPVPAFEEFSREITPSIDMWKEVSWFALACAAMVDFFTLILSYRLESTAPGPLTEEEQELAFAGLRQFSEFTINHNDELQLSIERSELERARRVSDWMRLFVVAFLLNRGYLRKIRGGTVEFAPNLYPIIAERLNLRKTPANQEDGAEGVEKLRTLMERKFHG
jgi:hypothetical protein